MNAPLIFKHFEKLSQTVPWISLGEFPTPVERLENLGKELGLKNLWIKRDDLSGRLYGGNKVRTLEFSLAQAQENNVGLLFAYSAIGSSWPLACAIYARSLGMPTDVFFMPYPMDSIKDKNLQATERIAHRVTRTRSLLTFPVVLYLNLYKARQNQKVCLMPPGGTSPITTLGYVNAVLELREQCERGEMPVPDYIFCPLGSGGTAAGLAIGLSLVCWPTRVIAVRVVDLIVANRLTLNHLIRKTRKEIQKRGVAVSSRTKWGENVEIEHRYFGKGYGRITTLAEKSIRLLNDHENHPLDATYTGKTFAAICQLSQKHDFKDKVILFWQTLNSRSLDNVVAELIA